jgi:hypothetical protein
MGCFRNPEKTYSGSEVKEHRIWIRITAFNAGVWISVQKFLTPPPPKKKKYIYRYIYSPVFELVLRIRIGIIFQVPDLFPGVLGSGSISYSNEHNKINWKGKFNEVCLLVRSWWTY